MSRSDYFGQGPAVTSPVGAINSRVGNAANMVRKGQWTREQALAFLAGKLKPEDMVYATWALDKHLARSIKQEAVVTQLVAKLLE